MTLGYLFNTSKAKYIRSMRLSFTASNLALFTKYTGLDPELNINGANGFGSDGGIYPRTTTVAIGLNVTLK
jgi:iron complex outermembrane receptor protein